LDHRFTQNVPSDAGVANAVPIDPLAQLGDELLADIPSDVGLEQKHFQLFVEIVIERGAIEKPRNFAEDATTRFFERFLKLDIGFRLSPEESAEYHQLHLAGDGNSAALIKEKSIR
jgi:hypothetical protein